MLERSISDLSPLLPRHLHGLHNHFSVSYLAHCKSVVLDSVQSDVDFQILLVMEKYTLEKVMPLRLSTVFCLTMYLVESPFPAQWEEPVLRDPFFKRLHGVASMFRVPKELGIFELLHRGKTFVPF